jgi:hypothetical protein
MSVGKFNPYNFETGQNDTTLQNIQPKCNKFSGAYEHVLARPVSHAGVVDMVNPRPFSICQCTLVFVTISNGFSSICVGAPSFALIQGAQGEQAIHVDPFLQNDKRVYQVGNKLCIIQKGSRWIEDAWQ